MSKKTKHYLTSFSFFLFFALLPPITFATSPQTSAVKKTLSLPHSVSQLSEQKIRNRITPELQERILDYFSENDCEKIKTSVNPSQYSDLRPLVLAVLAYCSPTGQDPEKLFETAEHLDPSSDTIVVLHARYRWKLDPTSSEALWQKVLLLARTQSVRRLAKEYLSGNTEGNEELFLGHGLTYSIFVQTGEMRESNPLGISFSDNSANPANALQVQAALGIRQSHDHGSVSGNYSLTNNRYFSNQSLDLFEHDLDIPITLRAGPNEDIVFRPFASYVSISHAPLQAIAGLGVFGVAYRNHYKQSVQGSFYQEKLYPEGLDTQQGAHYRFEYNWELYPSSQFFRFMTYIEHVKAKQDVDESLSLSINYSHTDIGLVFNYEYDFKWFTLGLLPKIIIREDNDNSSYLSTQDLSQLTKRRQDFSFSIQPNLTLPILSSLQLFAWYEWSRIYSNIGPDDYFDRNNLNQVIGIALRGFLNDYL